MKKVIYVIGAIIVSITVFLYLNLDSSTSGISSNNVSGTTNVSGMSNSDKDNIKNVIKDELPSDFEKVRNEFRTGIYTDMANLSREYYARPEFYYGDTYKQDAQKKLGKIGYGTVIIESSYNAYNLKAGQYMDVYTFIRAVPGIDSYQKFGLLLQSPDDKLFETYIDPSNITLSPTYPEINYSSDWIYKIKMKIVTKKDVPKGRYVFKLETVGAPIQPEKFFDFILYVYDQDVNPTTTSNKFHK